MSRYQLFADLVLVLHFAIVLFVVGGLILIVAGNLRGWRWVNALGFRLAHLAAIGVVVAESWLGLVCPLTTLEAWLRQQAGLKTYSASFLEHWVQRLLYYDAPAWMFMLAYTLFALAVVSAWWFFPPRTRHKRQAFPRTPHRAG
jgi:hypothetical protein